MLTRSSPKKDTPLVVAPSGAPAQ